MSEQIKKTPLRARPGSEFKTCSRCKENLDIINFHVYWYQATWNGEKVGEREQRRLNSCKECTKRHNIKKL
jgi:hypothetical protein